VTESPDWLAWHEAYDDPASPLSRRLTVVRRRLGEAVDGMDRARRLRLLSLCAGDGRDVVPVLAERHRERLVTATLVERHPELCRRAREAASAHGLDPVTVRCADAGDPASFVDVLPVDVLLLCGVFGNVDHDRVHDVVAVVPQMLTDDGSVIWTRGASEPDRRPEIRRWFREAGLAEVAFDGAPEPFGVGVNRLVGGPGLARRTVPDRLFVFSRDQ
jgi:hypothetical protein